MTTAEDQIAELRRLVIARDDARQAVVQWMNDEGAAMRLRQNSDAPGWRTYEEAENELGQFIACFGNSIG